MPLLLLLLLLLHLFGVRNTAVRTAVSTSFSEYLVRSTSTIMFSFFSHAEFSCRGPKPPMR